MTNPETKSAAGEQATNAHIAERSLQRGEVIDCDPGGRAYSPLVSGALMEAIAIAIFGKPVIAQNGGFKPVWGRSEVLAVDKMLGRFADAKTGACGGLGDFLYFLWDYLGDQSHDPEITAAHLRWLNCRSMLACGRFEPSDARRFLSDIRNAEAFVAARDGWCIRDLIARIDMAVEGVSPDVAAACIADDLKRIAEDHIAPNWNSFSFNAADRLFGPPSGEAGGPVIWSKGEAGVLTYHPETQKFTSPFGTDWGVFDLIWHYKALETRGAIFWLLGGSDTVHPASFEAGI